MASFAHLNNKLMADRMRQQLPSPTDTIAPPPYTASEHDDDVDDDTDDEEPLRLTINAQHSIQGNNNLVPTSPTPLADATKFSTILLTALNQINGAAQAGVSQRRLRVDLTINCGINVVGDRNVIGNVGLKPKALAQAGPARPAVNAVVGAKRRAEEDVSVSQTPLANTELLADCLE
jgi:hypothetical protein